jgi:hypothetical protein
MRKLVYLPDPTVKFYYSPLHDEYFTEYEVDERCNGDDQESSLERVYEKLTLRPRKTNKGFLADLKKKFRSFTYDNPYFPGQLNRIELYEVIDDNET